MRRLLCRDSNYDFWVYTPPYYQPATFVSAHVPRQAIWLTTPWFFTAEDLSHLAAGKHVRGFRLEGDALCLGKYVGIEEFAVLHCDLLALPPLPAWKAGRNGAFPQPSVDWLWYKPQRQSAVPSLSLDDALALCYAPSIPLKTPDEVRVSFAADGQLLVEGERQRDGHLSELRARLGPFLLPPAECL